MFCSGSLLNTRTWLFPLFASCVVSEICILLILKSDATEYSVLWAILRSLSSLPVIMHSEMASLPTLVPF